MKRMISLLTICILTTFVSSAANISKEYQVGKFTGITVTGIPTVIITNGDGKSSVAAEGPSELIEKLELKVDNGNLNIYLEGAKNKKNTLRELVTEPLIKVYVEVDFIDNLMVKGSGDILLEEDINWAKNVTLGITGSGDINIENLITSHANIQVTGNGDINIKDVEVDELKSSIKGNGDIKIAKIKAELIEATIQGNGDIEFKSGNSIRALYNIKGNGDIRAKRLKVDNIEAEIKGSGDIRCQALKSISGTVDGNGTVIYSGKPKQVNVSKKGFRQVRY